MSKLLFEESIKKIGTTKTTTTGFLWRGFLKLNVLCLVFGLKQKTQYELM